MASRDILFTPWLKYLIRARAHGTLEEGISKWDTFACVCAYVSCPVHACVWLYACFLQSGQLILVLLAGALMYHWGSFETVSQVHWVRGDALQYTATLGRNGPCGTQAGAFCQSGAARYLRTKGWNKRKGGETDGWTVPFSLHTKSWVPAEQFVEGKSALEHTGLGAETFKLAELLGVPQLVMSKLVFNF